MLYRTIYKKRSDSKIRPALNVTKVVEQEEDDIERDFRRELIRQESSNDSELGEDRMSGFDKLWGKSAFLNDEYIINNMNIIQSLLIPTGSTAGNIITFVTKPTVPKAQFIRDYEDDDDD